jgi:hypothetical protein
MILYEYKVVHVDEQGVEVNWAESEEIGFPLPKITSTVQFSKGQHLPILFSKHQFDCNYPPVYFPRMCRIKGIGYDLTFLLDRWPSRRLIQAYVPVLLVQLDEPKDRQLLANAKHLQGQNKQFNSGLARIVSERPEAN